MFELHSVTTLQGAGAAAQAPCFLFGSRALTPRIWRKHSFVPSKGNPLQLEAVASVPLRSKKANRGSEVEHCPNQLRRSDPLAANLGATRRVCRAACRRPPARPLPLDRGPHQLDRIPPGPLRFPDFSPGGTSGGLIRAIRPMRQWQAARYNHGSKRDRGRLATLLCAPS